MLSLVNLLITKIAAGAALVFLANFLKLLFLFLLPSQH